MSMWIPRRGPDGKWSVYSIYLPVGLVWILLMVLTLLLLATCG